MGHQRLGGSVPNTRPWRKVIGLVAEGAAAEGVATATLNAAQRALLAAGDDPVLQKAFWVLVQLPQAAKEGRLNPLLGQSGIELSANATLLEVAAALHRTLERERRLTRSRSDLGLLAQSAAAEALMAVAADKSGDLFERSIAAKTSLTKLGTRKQFSRLTHEFFSRFIQRFLKYHLSRELSHHVGGLGRFRNPDGHNQFLNELDTHARERAIYVKTFGGEWLSKHRYENTLNEDSAKRFVYYAVEKLHNSLASAETADAV